MQTTCEVKQQRLVILDLFRALAILLVLGGHTPIVTPLEEGLFPSAFRIWRAYSGFGVNLFFVLSGYLVSGLFFSEWQKSGKVRPLRFLIRRGFKIYPSFYLLMLLGAISYYARDGHLPACMIGEVTFLQNYVSMCWGYTWSLAVEEQFYFALALLVAILVYIQKKHDTQPFKAFAVIIPTIVVCVQLLRIQRWRTYPFTFDTHVFPSEMCIDGLLLGTFASYFAHFKLKSQQLSLLTFYVLLCIASILIIASVNYSAVPESLYFAIAVSCAHFGFAILIWLLASRTLLEKWLHSATTRALARVGQYSYSIYIWHIPWQNILAGKILPLFASAPSKLSILIIYIFGSIMIGAIMMRLVEYPALALRDKICK